MTWLGWRLCAGCAALALSLPVAGAPRSQAPRQSTPDPAAQTRPQDSAQAAIKAGNPQRALEIADTALKAFPQDAQLRFIRAVSLHLLNRLPEAEAAFAAMTQEFPELPEPYNNLAVVRAAQGRLDQARVALEDALRAVPDYAVAHENLGDIYAQLAVRSYRSAQKLDPANKSIAPKLKLVSEVIAQASAGQAPTAQPSSGQASSGQSPAAQVPGGQPSTGTGAASSDETATGQKSPLNPPQSSRSPARSSR
jgi:tetratricopeptide (TPR) repeat protein